MTEVEWWACAAPLPMLNWLSGKVSDRKLRLFACACCRCIWDSMNDKGMRTAVEQAERYADGDINLKALQVAHDSARNCVTEATEANMRSGPPVNEYPASAAAYASDPLHFWDMQHAAGVCCADVEWSVNVGIGIAIGHIEPRSWVLQAETECLRDIFGNPFRPVAFDPAWRTTDVTLLASGIYAERAFDRMPILADALQDAGCDAESRLAHLRDTAQLGEPPTGSPKPPPATHVRGCWALDLVLGKE